MRAWHLALIVLPASVPAFTKIGQRSFFDYFLHV